MPMGQRRWPLFFPALTYVKGSRRPGLVNAGHQTGDRGISTTATKARLGNADRFHQNPILRDQEWNRATRPSWVLMVLTVAIVGVAFYYGFFGSGTQRAAGWTVGIAMIVVYLAVGWLRRIGARRRLRLIHGQALR